MPCNNFPGDSPGPQAPAGLNHVVLNVRDIALPPDGDAVLTDDAPIPVFGGRSAAAEA